MAIKLVLLKSGNELICDLTNMEIGEEDDKKVVGYYLNRPCEVDYQPTGTPNEYNIQLKQWMPLAARPIIPVAAGWVVTVVDPALQLYEVYKNQIMAPKGVQEWMGKAQQGATDHLEVTPEVQDFDGLTPEQYAIREAQRITTEKFKHNGQDNQDSSTDESTDSD